jgi:chromosome segregation ATPase
MTSSKDGVLDEARRTIKRVTKNFDGQLQRSEPVLESRSDRWRREAEESEKSRAKGKAEIAAIERTSNSVDTLKAEMASLKSDVASLNSDVVSLRDDLANSLREVSTLAEAMIDQIDALKKEKARS